MYCIDMDYETKQLKIVEAPEKHFISEGYYPTRKMAEEALKMLKSYENTFGVKYA